MNDPESDLKKRIHEVASLLVTRGVGVREAARLTTEIIIEQGIIGDSDIDQLNSSEFYAAMTARGYYCYLGYWSNDPIFGQPRKRGGHYPVIEKTAATSDELLPVIDETKARESTPTKHMDHQGKADLWLKTIAKAAVASGILGVLWKVAGEKSAKSHDAQYERNAENIGTMLLFSVLLLLAWIALVRFKRRRLPGLDSFSPAENPGCVWVFSGFLAAACLLVGNQWFMWSLVLAIIGYGVLKSDNNSNI